MMHYYLPLVALLFFPCFSHAQTTQQFMAWSAFLESDCSDTPTYDFMTPMNECLNTSSVSFNPYNLTSPFMKVVQKTGGDQLVGMGCTTSNCDTCKETETIQMKPCMSNSWLGNTTAYFLYLVVDGVVPLSKAGGIIYQYYAPDDTNCSGALMGANIQENGVCTNVGGGYYYSYSCTAEATFLTECVDDLCTQNCTTTSYPFPSVQCQDGSSGYAITTCYLPK